MAHFETAQSTSSILRQIVRTRNPIPLDGSPVVDFLFTAEVAMAVKSIRIIYVEATSSHAGVKVYVGKIGHPMYFSIYTTAVSQSAGATAGLTINPNREVLSADETITVTCAGFKSGTGTIDVQIELVAFR